jgi:predicted Fe-Mo cluster-binding NifX family protein
MNDKGGVGTSIVSFLAEKHVKQIVANEFGPKAQGLLEKLKIQMIVPTDRKQSVEEIIAKIQ